VHSVFPVTRVAGGVAAAPADVTGAVRDRHDDWNTVRLQSIRARVVVDGGDETHDDKDSDHDEDENAHDEPESAPNALSFRTTKGGDVVWIGSYRHGSSFLAGTRERISPLGSAVRVVE
jgi:hypothetical protein